uniref:guanine nucleotide exchange factor subunit RIC1-like n=1 Tax=Styela clava TaxID=7725 RepID=UPI00193AD4C7|nr:guanine nucleotide exchange factor subunit RIC1-like [Styela clava]
MYFSLGWPRTLLLTNGKSQLKFVSCNRYRMLFAVLTDDTISIWHCRPCVEIVCYQRSQSSVTATGFNTIAEWRHDSSMLAVGTTGGYLLIYQLEQDVKSEKGMNLFEYNQIKSPQGENSDGVPALRLCLKTTIEYGSPILSLSCVSDELLIATSKGEVELIPWYGPMNTRKLLNVQDMTFAVDLHSAGSMIRSKYPIHIMQLTYSPCLEGFTAVLSDGRAALLFITKSPSDEKSQSSDWKAHGIWANGLTKAVCCAVNNRYRLMAFGTTKGSCEVYSMDDVLGSLQFSHQMALSPKFYPSVYKNTGTVTDMQWTPDGCALALSWKLGGFSIWSVYGACLVCTLSADHAFTVDGARKQQSLFYSVCWGAEGYQLWMIQENIKVENANANQSPINESGNSNLNVQSNISSSSDDGGIATEKRLYLKPRPETLCEKEFIQFQFAKSALTMNPCSGNQSHVILQSEDRMFVSFGENRYSNLLSGVTYDEKKKKYISRTYLRPNSTGRNFEKVVGNKQWTVIQLPINYLNGNWPIRFSSIDKTGKLLAIAGNFGIAHYSLITRKWKLFGNIMQEKDMVVTGGLTWWDGLIIVACYNLVETQDEIRIYPHNTNLDNVFSYVKRVNSQVLVINVYLDMVIIFDSTYHIKIYNIKKEDKVEYSSASLTLLKEISMQRYVPYPSLVVSVMMASLHMESSGRKQQQHSVNSQQETEVLIINVAGRLLLLQHSQDEGSIKSKSTGKQEMTFQPPIVLASSVENIWASEYKNNQKVHLTDAVWFSCGSAGVRVWLPLFPAMRRSRSGDIGELDMQALLSKRITLTLEMDSCYPLAVLFENAVVIGVKNETSHHKRQTDEDENDSLYSFHFSTLERTCEIYLHQILRQLLRRNLGYHALQIASSCRSLSYFPHVLELMLHKVLEEEATSSTPIPDPLLPTIVKFIAEFPEYHETIVHCARKTEIALWQYLFNSVGNPKELFEDCLESDQLETAASYLIILQNLEKLSLARQDANRLLTKALSASMWSLSADIIRFLRAIGDGDINTTPQRHPVLLNTNIYPAVAPSPHHAMDDTGFGDTERETTSKPKDTVTRHGRTYSNYYELYPQKTSTTSQTTDHSSSYHPYVPHYPLNSYQRRRQLQSSLSHPATTEVTRHDATKLSPINEQNMTPECAEHYFIDIILSRQARQLLCDKNLFELATFAAYMEFDLIPWLQKERCRAARILDAVQCLTAVHTNFKWPYPAIMKLDRNDASPINKSFNQGNGNEMIRGTISADRLSRNSAYSSNSDLLTVLSISDNANRKYSMDNYDVSETSSLNDDDICSSVLEGIYESYVLDRSAQSPQTREQLIYIFNVMLKSGCIEWAIILSIVLHDTERSIKVINMIREDKDLKLDILQRARDCVTQINKWACDECNQYEQVLSAMQEQFNALNELVNEREIEYAEQQAVIAQQTRSTSEMSDRIIPRSRHISREDTPSTAAKENLTNENNSLDEVFTVKELDVSKSSPKEQQQQHTQVSSDSTSKSTPVESEDSSESEEVEESCSIS